MTQSRPVILVALVRTAPARLAALVAPLSAPAEAEFRWTRDVAAA
jgi:hypothetical protein